MKKLLIGIAPLFLVGCSFLPAEEKPNPVEVVQPITVDSLMIHSGDTGLVLKSSVDKNFKNVISTHPIIEAEIKDGVLTYTEDIDSVPMTRAVNLEEFVNFLNK